MCHAAEILLVLAPLTCPQELLQTSPQKRLAEDSLSCSAATGDYTLDAMSRSTEILFNCENPCCMASSDPCVALPYCRIDRTSPAQSTPRRPPRASHRAIRDFRPRLAG